MLIRLYSSWSNKACSLQREVYYTCLPFCRLGAHNPKALNLFVFLSKTIKHICMDRYQSHPHDMAKNHFHSKRCQCVNQFRRVVQFLRKNINGLADCCFTTYKGYITNFPSYILFKNFLKMVSCFKQFISLD